MEAVFVISGAQGDIALSTRAGESFLSTTLQTGDYSAFLQSFTLYKDDGAGAFHPVTATAESSSESFTVFANSTTVVHFQFETNGAPGAGGTGTGGTGTGGTSTGGGGNGTGGTSMGGGGNGTGGTGGSTDDAAHCTGSGLVFTVPDACMDDGGMSGGGDNLEVYCVAGRARFCLSHEACPWRTALVDTAQTCERSGLTPAYPTYMASAWCELWKGKQFYECDTTGQIFFPATSSGPFPIP